MTHDFETNVEVDIDYDSVKPKGYDYESRSSRCDVAWQVIMDMRKDCIKGLSVIANDQEVRFTVNLLKDGEEESVDLEVVAKISDIEIEENSSERQLSSIICPDSINIEIEEIRQLADGSFQATGSAILNF